MIWRDSDFRSSVRRVGRVLLLLAPLLLLPGAACAPEPRSGLEGISVIGPTHPRVRAGDQGPDEVPCPATLLILASSDRHPVARVTTGPDGRFRLDLPPGEYRVTVDSRAGKILPRITEEGVRILPGRVTHVTLRLDSGMR